MNFYKRVVHVCLKRGASSIMRAEYALVTNHRLTRHQVARRDNIRPLLFRECDVEMIKNCNSRYFCVPGCSSQGVQAK